MNQNSYVKTIKPLNHDAGYSQFASIRMNFSWFTHTRPECSYEVFQLAQVTYEIFYTEQNDVINRFNKLVSHVHKHTLGIIISNLYMYYIKIVGFSEESFSGNEDFTSQL